MQQLGMKRSYLLDLVAFAGTSNETAHRYGSRTLKLDKLKGEGCSP